ncbi:MAG: hypothetical protein QM530_09365 [Phycisphaerales bacterium]|nr:hypothetical protein [Phycisphaerales bacterium]
MKKIQLFALLMCICCSYTAHAQNNAPNIGCKDATLIVQSSDLKKSLIQQGFEVMNDAMLSMDSRDAFPVIVRMQSGVFYQIVFIGNPRSKKMSLELLGIEKESLMQKKLEPYDQGSNTISFSFTPATSGDYTFMLNQAMRQQLFKGAVTACGSFCILRLKKTTK